MKRTKLNFNLSSLISHLSSLKAFTLIELLIVIVIVGVLATIFVSNYLGVRQRANDSQRKSNLRQIQAALELYRYDLGSYPTSLKNCPTAGTHTYFGDPTCTVTYMQKIPVDPQGTSYYNSGNYYYTAPGGTGYTLCSCLENANDSQGADNGTCSNPIAASFSPVVSAPPPPPAGFFSKLANLIPNPAYLSKLPKDPKQAGVFAHLAGLFKTIFLEKFQKFPTDVVAQSGSFPTVATTATSEETSAVTTHNIALPSGIVAGETLVAIIAVNTGTPVTWPAGWTEFFNKDSPDFLGLFAAWRKATGTEGATVDVTTAFAKTTTHQSYRISDAADPTVTPPQGSAGLNGNSSSPNPDALTPTGGAKDYLWLAIEGHSISETTSAARASYTNLVTFKRIGTARRNLNAANEDPASFSISGSNIWVAGTLAVHPAGPLVTPTPTIAPTSAPTSTPIPTPIPIPACSTGKFFVLESQ